MRLIADNVAPKIAANDNREPLGYAELTTTRGITFSRRHLKRLEDEKRFPLRVMLGENRIGWVVMEDDDEWLGCGLIKPWARDGRKRF